MFCPKDVKNMFLQQARSICWKKWAAKHEYEELKEGIWLEPALALLRQKTKEEGTEKHRNVARNWFRKEDGCRRSSATSAGRMRVSVPSMSQGGRHRKALPRMVRSQTGDSRSFQKVGAKSVNLKEGVEMAKKYCNAPTQ